MLEYFDLSMLGSRAMMLLGMVLLLTIYLYRHAGRRWFPPIFLVAASLGASYHTGVLRQSAVDSFTGVFTDKIDAVGARANSIGNQAHATSAGGASENNEAYSKRMDRKKKKSRD
jgi:hypothetical protein